MGEFKEYPKVMKHPGHKDATLSTARAEVQNESGLGLVVQGTMRTEEASPQFLPDITVHNRKQEEDAAAKGYLPAGTSDAAAYLTAVLGTEAAGAYEFQEYPKWMYHPTEEPKIVESRAAEAALGKEWSPNPEGPFDIPDGGEEHRPYIEPQAAPPKPPKPPRRRKNAAAAPPA